MVAADAGMNGNNDGAIADVLQEDSTVGYRPSLPLESMWASGSDMPQTTLRRDIEFMQMHPIVYAGLEYYKSGIMGAEFWGGPDQKNPDNEMGKPISPDPRVAQFVLSHVERFWQRGVPLFQEGGYPYGWSPGEHIYKEHAGMMVWSHLKSFHPNDGFILTLNHQPIGLRIKNIRDAITAGAPPDRSDDKTGAEAGGTVDLWFASDRVPAKAAWYPHRARFNQFYGRSQLTGGWRPWRRLGWRDAVEQVIDAAVYRAGYRGPIVRHPKEDAQTAMTGIPATKTDSRGGMRRSARDVARQIVEWAKAGAGFTLSSEQYPAAQGGGLKWDIDWPDHAMDVSPLIEAAHYLEDQILLGIGVPPELIKAGGTGSGYSGRSIPREAFLDGQQRIADLMLQLFVEQVIKPLVLWNFGDVPFSIQCKSLLKTQAADKQGQDEQQGGEGKPPQQQPPQQPPPQQPQPNPSAPDVAMSIDQSRMSRALDIVNYVMRKREAALSADSYGHQHKGSGPGGGQFTSSGGNGSAVGVTAAKSTEKPAASKGFDRIQDSQAVRDYLSGNTTHDVHYGAASSREDTLLTEIMKETGRAGKPRTASKSEMDVMAKNGWSMCYRGVGDAKYADQFCHSDNMYNGAGSFGNGSYFTVSNNGWFGGGEPKAQKGAQLYAAINSTDGKGATMRMAFPPDAKVVTHDQLKKEQKAALKGLQDQFASGAIDDAAFFKAQDVYLDCGRFAALKNYDAIHEKTNGFLVVLNRSKCVVQKEFL